jgi:hypothetical protein
MVDSYTKAVLTVIACALLAIALQQFVNPAQSQGGACGDRQNPCSVTTVCKRFGSNINCDSLVSQQF